MKNLASFHRSTWKCWNWDFNRILLSKVENAWAKSLLRGHVLWHWRMMKNLKRKWLVISELSRGTWQILTRGLKSLENFHFNGLLLSKVCIILARNVQRSYLSWHWRVMQNLKKKLTCGLENDKRNLAYFHQSTWNSPNGDFDVIFSSKAENVWA